MGMTASGVFASHSLPQEPPRVSPVGVVERTPGFLESPRVYGCTRRIAAACILALFATVSVGTTVASLASYCITSEAGPMRTAAPIASSAP